LSTQKQAPPEQPPLPETKKLRKWHFLLLAGFLILLSVYLWYWNWRALGLPGPLQPEHGITLATYLVGVFVLGLFVYRLTRRQVTIMLVGMVAVNLLAALATLWIFRTYPVFFELLQPASLGDMGTSYAADWRAAVLNPALLLIHGGLLLIWAECLLMFFIRNPEDRPE
jgi:hypothetical protein